MLHTCTHTCKYALCIVDNHDIGISTLMGANVESDWVCDVQVYTCTFVTGKQVVTKWKMRALIELPLHFVCGS